VLICVNIEIVAGKEIKGKFQAPPSEIWLVDSFSLEAKLFTVLISRTLWNTFSLLKISSKTKHSTIFLFQITNSRYYSIRKIDWRMLG
jgi:hypothetical protein